MTLGDLRNARDFLRRIAVGKLDEERLIATIYAVEREIERREKKR
jgi:hypothetical protein